MEVSVAKRATAHAVCYELYASRELRPDQPYVSYFISSSFRVQISASVLLLTASTHAACYPHVPKASPRSSDTNLNLSPEKIHSQPIVTSISGFDCTSAFETSDFRQRPSFRFQTSISDFRFLAGKEIEIEG